MYVKPFEQFLIESFIEWVQVEITPGSRFQFKSPDPDNSKKLFETAIANCAEEFIEVDKQNLRYIQIGEVKLIPVLHGSEIGGCTENYISRLRDLTAGREGQFEKAALLIIHNSMLDTIINSALDLSAEGEVWNPLNFSKILSNLIDTNSPHQELSACLLEDQLARVIEERATIFGLSALYCVVSDDGVIEFDELGLFNDPLILSMNGNKEQIRKRINANRKLKGEIQGVVESFDVDQLEYALKELSPKFIKKHFQDENDWASVEYEEYLSEINNNNTQKLILEEVDVFGATFYKRSKSQTKSGERDISLLIQLPTGTDKMSLELTFIGNDLDKSNFKISHNKDIAKEVEIVINRAGGKRCRANFHIPVSAQPTFFSIELKRENRSEEYKFRCLVVEEGDFYFGDVTHRFRVEPLKGVLTLLMEEDELRIREDGYECCILDVDYDIVDCNLFSVVNFESHSNQNELIQFELQLGEKKLPINVEGPAADAAITIPLLFDRERFGKLFRDDRNAEYISEKSRVVFDNAESNLVGVRQMLLGIEARMIDEKILYIEGTTSSITLDQLREFYPDLHNAYEQLFEYFILHNTLPSLTAWGPDYCSLVQRILDAYEAALNAIPPNTVFETQHKNLMRIGLCKQVEWHKMSPLHPLVLAYHLQLVCAIREDMDQDGKTSFSDLPDVTRDRLTAAGLLPYVYDNSSQYAHITPLKENCFWLELVPQREENYFYVKRLVRDKLNEFIEAYSRLFVPGKNSSLIINAINQGCAAELFLGIVEHFKQHGDKSNPVHVNCYDENILYNDFDRFAETGSYAELKSWLGLNAGATKSDAESIIDVVRSRLTYSKFLLPRAEEHFEYAHLAFFKNKEPVECHPIKIDSALSGVLCDGLIAGEAAETKGNAYFTAFGLRNVNAEEIQSLRLARVIANLWQPAQQPNAIYLENSIGIAVSSDFKHLLIQSYDSALWTTLIDPKVTLDFFTTQKDVVLIHYSDQYTSSAGYDAITVTKEVELFERLLQNDSGAGCNSLMSEFNAFNGEWLLKMLTSNSKDRKEKNGIIAAYKFVRALLGDSGICWIPLSVAEMIRVSGNVGLKMSDSEFSRNLHGYRKGAISDDVLFVGFKDKQMFLLPLEVKTGARPDFKYAGQQAQELKRYLIEDVLGPNTLAAKLYRSLFIRQVLMQVDKYRLYQVFDDEYMQPLLENREWWLRGNFNISAFSNAYQAIVVANIEDDTCFSPSFTNVGNGLLQIEMPYALMSSLISLPFSGGVDKLLQFIPAVKDFTIFDKPFPMEAVSTSAMEFEVDSGGFDSMSDSINPELMTEFEGEFIDTAATTSSATQSVEQLRILFGHNTLDAKPLFWEPTNTSKCMNTNTGIIGTMGTGKTQFTKALVSQLISKQGHNVHSSPIGLLIFDYKSDYIDDAFALGVNATRLKLFRLPYNPLSLYGDMPMLPVHTASSFAETLTKAFGLGPKQQLRLRKLILEAYEQVGIYAADSDTWHLPAPTLQQLWDLYLTQEKVEEDSLYAALDSLVTYEIFEPNPEKVTSLFELLSGVIVIELASYSPQIQSLVVALTLDLFYSQMQKRGKPAVLGDFRQITKMVLVDEADNFMSQDFPSLRKILKEGREYGVGVILSTQDISHFKTGDNNYASYILTWVIHRVAEIKNSDIKAIFNKDEKAEQERLMEVIRKLEKHNSLYIDGDKKVHCMLDMAFWKLINNI